MMHQSRRRFGSIPSDSASISTHGVKARIDGEIRRITVIVITTATIKLTRSCRLARPGHVHVRTVDIPNVSRAYGFAELRWRRSGQRHRPGRCRLLILLLSELRVVVHRTGGAAGLKGRHCGQTGVFGFERRGVRAGRVVGTVIVGVQMPDLQGDWGRREKKG